jgi:hypothetical protein
MYVITRLLSLRAQSALGGIGLPVWLALGSVLMLFVAMGEHFYASDAGDDDTSTDDDEAGAVSTETDASKMESETAVATRPGITAAAAAALAGMAVGGIVMVSGSPDVGAAVAGPAGPFLLAYLPVSAIYHVHLRWLASSKSSPSSSSSSSSSSSMSALGMAFVCHVLSVPVLAVLSALHLEQRQIDASSSSSLAVNNNNNNNNNNNTPHHHYHHRYQYLPSQPSFTTTTATADYGALATAVLASGCLAALVGVSTALLHKRLTATSNVAIANCNTLAGLLLVGGGSAAVALGGGGGGRAATTGASMGSPSHFTGGACVMIACACAYFFFSDSAAAADGDDEPSLRGLLRHALRRRQQKGSGYAGATPSLLPLPGRVAAKLAIGGCVLLASLSSSSPWSSSSSLWRPVDRIIIATSDKPIAMRLVVITGGTRVDSLYRLIDSLCHLQGDGDRIDLDVWIDVPEGHGRREVDEFNAEGSVESILRERRLLAQDIEMLGKNGSYANGRVRAHIWEEHMGLRGQWLDAWHASIPGGLTESTEEIGLILEDDMQLSPFAWRWLKAAYAAYGQDRRVAGFTVQRATLCLARCPNINGGPDEAGGGFLYPLIGTWGYSPTARSFARFRRWYYSLPQNFKPYVEGTSPTDWYKSFEKAGTEKKRMWEMHHLKYTDTHEDKYTVYVKCKDNKTLGVNHRETGLNFDGKDPSKKGAMHNMLTEWDPDLIRFAKSPFVLNYSAVVVDGFGLASGTLVN